MRTEFRVFRKRCSSIASAKTDGRSRFRRGLIDEPQGDINSRQADISGGGVRSYNRSRYLSQLLLEGTDFHKNIMDLDEFIPQKLGYPPDVNQNKPTTVKLRQQLSVSKYRTAHRYVYI